MLKSEAVEGGRLSLLRGVYVGDYKVLPANDYPAAQVMFDGADVTGSRQKAEITVSLIIYIFSIKAEQTESLDELSKIAWNESDDSGVIPLFLENAGFTIDSRLYKIETGEVKIRPGIDPSSRYLWALELPLTIKTWKTLL